MMLNRRGALGLAALAATPAPARALTPVSQQLAPPDPTETIRLWPGAAPGGENVTVTPAVVERSTDPTFHDRSRVGGEHHVGQPRLGFHFLDLMPEPAVGVAQLCPLPHGALRIDGHGRVHPRVDGVVHGEVTRGTHHIVTGHWHAHASNVCGT